MIGRRYLTPLVPKSLILFVRLDFLMVGGPRLGSIGDLTTFSHHFFAHLTPELTAADRDGRVPAEISRSQHKPSQRLCHKQLLSALFADVEATYGHPAPLLSQRQLAQKIYWRCGYNREYKSPEIYPIARIAPHRLLDLEIDMPGVHFLASQVHRTHFKGIPGIFPNAL